MRTCLFEPDLRIRVLREIRPDLRLNFVAHGGWLYAGGDKTRGGDTALIRRSRAGWYRFSPVEPAPARCCVKHGERINLQPQIGHIRQITQNPVIGRRQPVEDIQYEAKEKAAPRSAFARADF
jgi:hypothetical protein